MNKVQICFEACVVDGEWLWISASNHNGLYKMNIGTGRITYCGTFPHEDILKERLHYGNAIIISNKIYFIPLESSYMHIYDTEKNRFECYQISNRAAGFCMGAEYNGKIYMISTRNMDISVYDILTNTIVKVYSETRDEWLGCAHGGCIYKDSFFSIARESNILRQYNMNTNNMKEWKLSNTKDNFEIIGIYDGKILLTNMNNKMVYSWDIKKKQIMYNEIKFEKKLNCWQNGERIITNNLNDKKIYMLNVLTKRVSIIYVENKAINFDPFIISTAFNYGKDIFFVNKQDNCVYSSISGKVIYPLFIDEKNISKRNAMIINDKIDLCQKVVKENKIFSFKDYIKTIVQNHYK